MGREFEAGGLAAVEYQDQSMSHPSEHVDLMNLEPVIPPSSLFVFWPGDEPPLEEEIRLRLAEWGHAADVGVVEDTHWCFRLELVDRPVSALVWAEEIGAGTGERLGLTAWPRPAEREAAARCRWMVGIECPLSLSGPSADYQIQLRLADAVSRDWAPAVFDANAGSFLTTADLQQLTSLSVPPRTSSLYGVHRKPMEMATECDHDGPTPFHDPIHDRANAAETYWVHTHGLERAGIPDLEIFDVPRELLPAAAELLESIADLWIEFQTPDPEKMVSIGPGLQIAWRPWHTLVAERDEAATGGWCDRVDGSAHTGYRAVLVEAAPRHPSAGPHASAWQAPLGVLRRLTQSETIIYKTVKFTRRIAQLARDRWGTFGLLFASRRPQDWRFTVKLEYPIAEESGDGRTEHRWYEVDKLRPGGIHGRLLQGGVAREAGEPAWHELARLTDWRIITRDRVYDPDTAGVLLEFDWD